MAGSSLILHQSKSSFGLHHVHIQHLYLVQNPYSIETKNGGQNAQHSTRNYQPMYFTKENPILLVSPHKLLSKTQKCFSKTNQHKTFHKFLSFFHFIQVFLSIKPQISNNHSQNQKKEPDIFTYHSSSVFIKVT